MVGPYHGSAVHGSKHEKKRQEAAMVFLSLVVPFIGTLAAKGQLISWISIRCCCCCCRSFR